MIYSTYGIQESSGRGKILAQLLARRGHALFKGLKIDRRTVINYTDSRTPQRQEEKQWTESPVLFALPPRALNSAIFRSASINSNSR